MPVVIAIEWPGSPAAHNFLSCKRGEEPFIKFSFDPPR
jgi:hypothetical protein